MFKNLCLGHVHKYAAVFGYFVDILICYILINFSLNYKVEINYAPIKKESTHGLVRNVYLLMQ